MQRSNPQVSTRFMTVITCPIPVNREEVIHPRSSEILLALTAGSDGITFAPTPLLLQRLPNTTTTTTITTTTTTTTTTITTTTTTATTITTRPRSRRRRRPTFGGWPPDGRPSR